MIANMFAPEFWWEEGTYGGLALSPIGALYGRIASWRMDQAGHSASLPVICVGNFTLGGAGKTPTALAIAELCKEIHLRPVFLTRGFGGREPGPIHVDANMHTAADVGDEALLLARSAATIVAVDRVSGADLACTTGADIIVMDDGFQNPSLTKDFSLMVVDAGRGAGNGRIFPAGPLRAPLTDQMRRADAVLIIGKGSPGNNLVRAAARSATPFMSAHFQPVKMAGFNRGKYLAFAGIARPSKFYDSLREARVAVEETMDFPDHHAFTEDDCKTILKAAEDKGLKLITTEKDHVRLSAQDGAIAELARQTQTFPVRIVFERRDRLKDLIKQMLKQRHMDAITGH